MFSRVAFYEYYTHAPRLLQGLTPVIDQTVAGGVLMVLGKSSMALAALVIFFRWFGGEQRADWETAAAKHGQLPSRRPLA